MRKEATLEQWGELYDVALNLRQLEPWKYFWDVDLVIIQLHPGEEPVFLSIMGRGGSCFGVSMYEGMDGLRDFDMIARLETSGLDPYYVMMEQSNISCYFGDRQEVPPLQKAVIKDLGLKFRGNGNWLYFESYKKGYIPYQLDAHEVTRMTEALQNLFMAVRGVKEERISVDYEKGQALWRQFNPKTEEWIMYEAPLPEIGERYPFVEFHDELLVKRIKKMPQIDVELALDIVYENTGIADEGYDRPLIARLFLVVDVETEFILDMNLMKPDDSEIDVTIDFLMNFIEANGRPKAIRARCPWVFSALGDLCDKCGIELKHGDMEIVDWIANECMEHLY